MIGAMSAEEIYTRFPDEWVFVVDPETDEALNVECGQVVCHSKSRDDIHREVMAVRPKRFAVWYTGNLRDDVVYVL